MLGHKIEDEADAADYGAHKDGPHVQRRVSTCDIVAKTPGVVSASPFPLSSPWVSDYRRPRLQGPQSPSVGTLAQVIAGSVVRRGFVAVVRRTGRDSLPPLSASTRGRAFASTEDARAGEYQGYHTFRDLYELRVHGKRHRMPPSPTHRRTSAAVTKWVVSATAPAAAISIPTSNIAL